MPVKSRGQFTNPLLSLRRTASLAVQKGAHPCAVLLTYSLLIFPYLDASHPVTPMNNTVYYDFVIYAYVISMSITSDIEYFFPEYYSRVDRVMVLTYALIKRNGFLY
jgi:hypothetical protein